MREIREVQENRRGFRLGDFEALRAAVDDPGIVSNGPMPLEIEPC